MHHASDSPVNSQHESCEDAIGTEYQLDQAADIGAEFRTVNPQALYAQFSPLVGGLLRRFGTSPELRKDLQGEIYYQFHRLVDSYDLERGIPLAAYITRMLSQRVFNYVRDYWRGESRYVSMEQETFETAHYLVSSDHEEYAEALYAEEVRNALPAAIASLPQRQRLVLVWRYYEERSFEDIAADLGVQPATARSLLRHAITSLRTRLARQGVAR